MAERKQEKYEETMLYRIRHSTAHIMAQAVMEMFPGAQIAIGPAIEDGFYYDFDLPRTLTPEDLAEIEKRMREIFAEIIHLCARWSRLMKREKSLATRFTSWS